MKRISLLNTNRIKYFFLITVILLALPIPSLAEGQNLKKAVTLELEIDNIINDQRLKGAITGVSIRKADSGEIVYSSYGDIRLHPASNMKLLTAAAALEQLGPDYQFSTEVWMDGRIKRKVLKGNLYLKGKGDPTLMKEDLDLFAKKLKAKGITKINGNLVGDDSWYDSIRLSQDLNWSDESFHTGAQVSALTLSPSNDYDSGTVLLEINPAAKIGKKAKIQVTPKNEYVTIMNLTKTVETTQASEVSFERLHGENTIIVKGTIPQNSSTIKKWAAVWEPTEYAIHVFKTSLKEYGITFTGKSEMKTGVTPKEASKLAVRKSMPLKDLLIPFMKLSNNGHAEVLTKEMGKVVYGEGSWEAGLQVIKETVSELGLHGNTIQLRDGSGMSHKNMIPANELSKLLFIAQKKSWFPEFERSLPVAGQPDKGTGGTLRNRLKDELTIGNVRAKTGSISGVSTLSGYVTARNGEKFIFSILINNYLAASVTDIEDRIVRTLAEY
ncbi:D-alanyl-D-alanine carboxypeptidase/D-alanyl-D-alanine endopeptidase [Niallia endozanthoxylica]|uniref:D-alanyl-D-alanine carboxypeptidase/D-alanyl-D-alanine-endopeptidase n=1 Tax=Niallia endozanthoxylica TaxID=2036016 RepID=A0A5J5HQ87_9BACI|nr:D-alanyl-D-alanine carboxypeptidase/D-alanyl-D-alanine-endopeptidase [Niallia endozanthoxylica]KAA9023849.1 D-alanyl-D-alanine carboxypeptidase/D-alanyl-D-alanine-endopeptidase [Niallia endozanthoxylica]